MSERGQLSPAVILTHDNTDFDALASLLAAAKLYPEAAPVVPARLNRNVREFLSLYGDALPFVEARALPKRHVSLAILVDTQSASPVRGMDAATQLLAIDHHPRSAALPATAAYEGEPLGATTTLLVERLRTAEVGLSVVEASLLLLGIYEDTGSLTYQGTTPRDLEAAAWLLAQGADLAIVERFLRTPLAAEQQALYTRLVNDAEFLRVQERSIVIAAVRLERYVEELATLAHKLVDLFDPDACFLLAEYERNVQVIARSTTDAIDVGALLRQMHGGGHPKAAAAVVPESSLGAVRERLLDLLRIHVQPAVTVAQVMSYGVHTLSPNLTIAEANARMRRYGHEGFPVVEGGRLVGVLTRSEIDRALHHNLGAAPVRAYMRAGAVSVGPNDPIAEVQRIMMEHGLGQVPVVDGGRVLGIVTRTDLIKLWSAPPRPSRQAQIADLLGQTLPAPLLELLLAARDEANDLGYSLYVVGGFVRDLLLGQPTLDLDLVVEGNAIALARRLAARLGGQMRSHGRFGTAKLILPEERPAEQPASLDFVTARTEFYAHPTALPQVERSSIKQDLYRRDFTINTMAICLDRARYGELLDYYGGERDLREGLVRVLHSLSFVEDPTRMLRAVRFEVRLGFQLEDRTEELLRGALDLLDRVSGDRLRHELLAILREPAPERAWARLGDLGILQRLSPALHADGWAAEKLRALRRCCNGWGRRRAAGEVLVGAAWPEVASGHVACELVALAILTMRLRQPELAALNSRLMVPRNEAGLLKEAAQLYRLLPQLTQDMSGSALATLLRPFSEGALFAGWVIADDPLARDQLLRYQCQLRLVRPTIDGRRLRELGLKPGPSYRHILDALRDARLDGLVSSEEEEEALLQRLVAEAQQEGN
ncbi:MAG TPA: CBS domain-containing protein [Anaerolineae bacterium]|nr:CBS domain-containing protein [Anaerolineae bacterium]HPL29147.1 CBS domain-containing protein [Anaerolineae bacterium]